MNRKLTIIIISAAVFLGAPIAAAPGAAAVAAAPGAAAVAAADEMPPLFRLSIGGRPFAPPLLDATRARAALWVLSEDESLYLLAEDGRLLLKQAIAGLEPWLGLDTFGRALVVTRAGQGPRLAVRTRAGNIAWSYALGQWLGASREAAQAGAVAFDSGGGRSLDSVAFGPDGRFLLIAGKRLLCLSVAGRELWHLELPASSSCAPVLDAAGNFLIGMSDGKVLELSPYGERMAVTGARAEGASANGPLATALCAFGQSVAIGYGDGSVAVAFIPGREGAGKLGAVRTLDPAAFRARAVEIGKLNDAITSIALDTEAIDKIANSTPSAKGAAIQPNREPAREVIFALDRQGGLGAFGGDGRRLWSVETGIPAASIFLASSRIVVTGMGKAASYSLVGELLREASVTNAVSPALLAPSGLLFSAASDWVVSAYRYEGPLERAVPPQAPACPADQSAVGNLGLFTVGPAAEDRQIAIVADIQKSLDSAGIGLKEAGDRAVLEAIAKGSIPFSGEAATQRRFRLFARPRIEACRLLGEIGSPASIDALADIALTGGDPTVEAAAYRAIGTIGVDPEGRADRALAVAGSARLDDEVALALVEAIEALALHSGETPGAEAARSLVVLSGPRYPSVVRSRAMDALSRLVSGSALD